ncbi:potassium channel protein [Halobacteriales archaeon QH_6_64_20]|nr:MAG: potassium channel protein [Halobacteriales archaeon QH_6_64_20]
MDWRGRSVLGGRAALWLSVAVALSSVLTSVLTIGIAASPALVVNVVPTEIRQTAEFLGALVGFCLLLSVLELRRGFRAAWYATTLFITVGGVLGAIQSSGLSLPTVVLALIALPVVLGNRGRFDRELDLSTAQVAALTALGGALVYSTVGAYALREEFGGVDGLVDAFYFAVVTASTVGYGDVTASPNSPSARLFVVSVVVVSTASFALVLGSLLGPAIEARLTSALGIMTDSQLEALDDHVIVLGYGDLTEPILDELGDRNDRSERTPFVVTPETPAAELRETDRSVLVGNPSDDEPLRRAGIERARAVVAATESDAKDAFSVLAAWELNPDVRIVAAATDRENVPRSCVDWRNSMLTMNALCRETGATSRIQLTQELNRSSSRGSAVLHKSVERCVESAGDRSHGQDTSSIAVNNRRVRDLAARSMTSSAIPSPETKVSSPIRPPAMFR